MRCTPLIAATLALSGCGGTTDLGGHADVTTDPAVDTSEDPTSDIPTDTGVDAGIEDGPLTFVFSNATDGYFYIDWTFLGQTAVYGRRLDTADPEFMWFHPPCAMDCAEIPPGECGCILCEEPLPVARRLGPGETITVTWDGPDVFRYEEDPCGCRCSRPALLTGPGQIEVAAVAWSGFACYDCFADEDGIMAGASVDGGPVCATRTFDIPFGIHEIVFGLYGSTDCWDWPLY